MRRRIAQLNYTINHSSETVSVSPTAEPFTVQFGDFSCEVTAQQLVARPSSDYEDVSEARVLLEPFLEAWSASTELFNYCPMTFSITGQVYEHLDTEDKDIAYADVATGTAVVWTATPEPPPPTSRPVPTGTARPKSNNPALRVARNSSACGSPSPAPSPVREW